MWKDCDVLVHSVQWSWTECFGSQYLTFCRTHATRDYRLPMVAPGNLFQKSWCIHLVTLWKGNLTVAFGLFGVFLLWSACFLQRLLLCGSCSACRHPILHYGVFKENIAENEGPHDKCRGIFLCQQLGIQKAVKNVYRSRHGTSLVLLLPACLEYPVNV